jgi:proline dehydrogenase
VDAVHATTPEGFAAVKVTALGDPALLERVSTAVRELRAFFETLDPAKQGVISRDAFRRGWREAFEMSDEEIEAVFERIDTDMDGDVDLVEFTNALPLHAIGPLVQRCRSKGPLYRSALDVDECAGLERMLARLDDIALHAKALGVRLMIDAEHTYFQPAIDHTVLRLSRAHNREYPVVFGTYQAYLRECDAKLRLDLDRAHREGWHLGAKLVRGAYMVHERQRAKEHGYHDPIHPTVRVHPYYPDCPPHQVPDCHPHHPDHGH